uniref:E3 ubiquitin-protein ligase n=1 Tax=Mesocestoides corti TaxID=53468 RepID=A0A5K3FRR6_MESCO
MDGSNASDCPICLQPLLQPVEISCGHIFCYLCIKGSAFHRRQCPLCRGAISMNFFDNPNVIRPTNTSQPVDRTNPEFAWYYEGHNGWWQYDERTAVDIETAFSQSLAFCEVFVAGHFYVIDFTNMCQYRKDRSGRSRRIKRDSVALTKKGVAGIRLSILESREAGDEGECDAVDTPSSMRRPSRPSSHESSSSTDQRSSHTGHDHNYALRPRSISTTSNCRD